jgi:hypothetical protein
MADALDNQMREPAEPETQVPKLSPEVKARLDQEFTDAKIEGDLRIRLIGIVEQVLPLILAAAKA